MAHQVVWFDIPVTDLDRAIRFYSAVLGAPVKKETFGEMAIGIFPHAGGEVGGCLFVSQDASHKPSAQGPLIYLNAQGRLDEAVAAAQKQGGKIVLAKESIGPHGFRAIVLDSEGNRVALHSM